MEVNADLETKCESISESICGHFTEISKLYKELSTSMQGLNDNYRKLPKTFAPRKISSLSEVFDIYINIFGDLGELYKKEAKNNLENISNLFGFI